MKLEIYRSIMKDISKLKKGDRLCISDFLHKYGVEQRNALEYSTAILRTLGDSIWTADDPLDVAPDELCFIKLSNPKFLYIL